MAAVTIKQIADASGVSDQTVSRVLNPRTSASHSAETRERVLSAARELGYRPNRHARQMRQGRFGAAAILTNSAASGSALSNNLIWGVQTTLSQYDMNLTLGLLSDPRLTAGGEPDPEIARRLSSAPDNHFLQEWMADGFLVHFTDGLSSALKDRLHHLRAPFVWVNFDEKSDCILYDDWQGGRDATEYLLRLGHRRIAFVAFPGIAHYSAAARIAGYEQAMTGAGQKSRVIQDNSVPPGQADQWIRWFSEWLTGPERPTAVLCYSVEIAWTVIHVAGINGMGVPRDLSVMTFRRDEGGWAGTQISAMVLREREMGVQAVEMLMEKIKEPGRTLAPVRLAERLDAQQTTAAPTPK